MADELPSLCRGNSVTVEVRICNPSQWHSLRPFPEVCREFHLRVLPLFLFIQEGRLTHTPLAVTRAAAQSRASPVARRLASPPSFRRNPGRPGQSRQKAQGGRRQASPPHSAGAAMGARTPLNDRCRRTVSSGQSSEHLPESLCASHQGVSSFLLKAGYRLPAHSEENMHPVPEQAQARHSRSSFSATKQSH